MCLLRENSIGPSVPSPPPPLQNTTKHLCFQFKFSRPLMENPLFLRFRLYLITLVIQMANLPPGDANREVAAQPVLLCHLLASGYFFQPVFSLFFFFLLIAQSVSMRLMLYVRLYTNYHIRKRESTFTLPNKAAALPPTPPPPPQHSAAARVLSISAVEKLMTRFPVGVQ